MVKTKSTSFPFYVQVKQPQKLFCINYSTSTQKCAEKDAPRRCEIVQTYRQGLATSERLTRRLRKGVFKCKKGPDTSERLTRPLRKGVFECEKRSCFEHSNVFMSHLRPSSIKLHQATMTAIEMKDAIALSRIHMKPIHRGVFVSHLRPAIIKLHQATMSAIEMKDAIAL